jgi:hypothetical protein
MDGVTRRVLPADVYDALELGALVFGGIGGGSLDDGYGQPLCAYGLAPVLGGKHTFDTFDPIEDALFEAGITTSENDHAVRAINGRLGRPANDRVTFRRWCKRLNVVREEAAHA